MWNFSDCSVALRFVFLTNHQRLNRLCVDVFISMRTASAAARMPVDCCKLHQQPVECWCCSSSNLCSRTLLWTAEHCNRYIFTDFWLKFCLLYWAASKLPVNAWYSVKIRAIFGDRFERRKVDKKSKPTWKPNHANSILQTFEYFCQITSKLTDTISSYTVSKLGRFLRHSVVYQ